VRESLSTGSCGAGVSAFRSLVCRQLSVAVWRAAMIGVSDAALRYWR